MMSYMPAQVKTEIFELTETHPILTFLKMTEKMFFHKKTTPIKNNSDLVFGEYSERGFCVSNIRHIPKIYTAFTMYDKFYSDNEVGQIIKNYTNSIA